MSRFADWQADYAARGISTFPVVIEGGVKRPAVRNYLKTGLRFSGVLARKFPDATACGFVLGSRTKLTVLDVDTPDERVLADALDRHGKTPLIVRSGGGNYQAFYRHNGERRHIRPDKSRPIDILGGGYTVAPPSLGARGRYEIIAGNLDDIDSLPCLASVFALVPGDNGGPIESGSRNTELWRHCMRHARSCDDFAALLDVAETFNSQNLTSPLSSDEVARTAQSAWQATERGSNRFGQTGAFVSTQEADSLAHDPYLSTLITWLRAHHRPENEFLVADGLTEILKWPREQLRRARRRAIEQGWFEMIRPPVKGRAALYRWGKSNRSLGLPDSVGQGIAGSKSGRGGSVS